MTSQWREWVVGWLLLVAAVALVGLAMIGLVLGGLWVLLYTAA